MSSTTEGTSRLAEAATAVAAFVVSDVPLQDSLDRVAALVTDAVEPAIGIGMTLVDERRRPATLVSTANISPVIDQAQYDDDDGPCLTAHRERRVVRVEDTRDVAGRWPRFSAVSSEHGVLSSLSLPLLAGRESYGALNLYATRVGAFTDADEAGASLFAAQAAVVLANARAYWGAFEMAEGLRTAMGSRATIEQAKGVVMASRHCGPEEAFAILVGASQRSNVKVRDLAARIVEGVQSPATGHALADL